MGTVVYPNFGGSARQAPPAVQFSPVPVEDGVRKVLEVGRRIQLPDGCSGNVEVMLDDSGIMVNFSNRHVESIRYDFATLAREIRRPRKGASVNGVLGFEAVTPVEVFYCGKVICSFIAVDAEQKQVTVLH